MKLVVAADHGGVELKDELARRLREEGHEVLDLGTNSTESVDYPDYALKAGALVGGGEVTKGILVCGTGIGMSIAANKVAGVRCAKVNSVEEGALAAEHNHANMLALGGRTTDVETAWGAVHAWLTTPQATGRHERRVAKIDEADRERSAGN